MSTSEARDFQIGCTVIISIISAFFLVYSIINFFTCPIVIDDKVIELKKGIWGYTQGYKPGYYTLIRVEKSFK